MFRDIPLPIKKYIRRHYILIGNKTTYFKVKYQTTVTETAVINRSQS